jgi:hypothetical protein
MAAKPRKSRPNEIAMDLSDVSSSDATDAKRTRVRHRTMNVGYARTSTIDQAAGLATQERDLKAAGAERIFGEQVSSTAKRAKRIRMDLPFQHDLALPGRHAGQDRQHELAGRVAGVQPLRPHPQCCRSLR